MRQGVGQKRCELSTVATQLTSCIFVVHKNKGRKGGREIFNTGLKSIELHTYQTLLPWLLRCGGGKMAVMWAEGRESWQGEKIWVAE